MRWACRLSSRAAPRGCALRLRGSASPIPTASNPRDENQAPLGLDARPDEYEVSSLPPRGKDRALTSVSTLSAVPRMIAAGHNSGRPIPRFPPATTPQVRSPGPSPPVSVTQTTGSNPNSHSGFSYLRTIIASCRPHSRALQPAASTVSNSAAPSGFRTHRISLAK